MYYSDSSGWQTPSEKSVLNSPKYPDSGNSDSDYASSVAILGEDGKLTSRERQRRFDYNLCLYCGNSSHMIRHCPKPQVRKCSVSDYSGSDSDSDNSGSNHNSGNSDADAESVTSVSDHHSVHSNPGSVPNSGSENSDSDPASGYSESDSESDDSDSEGSD